MNVPRDPESAPSFLLAYLIKTSAERARTIRDVATVSPSLAELLIDLEVDDNLRARFEVALLESHLDPS